MIGVLLRGAQPHFSPRAWNARGLVLSTLAGLLAVTLFKLAISDGGRDPATLAWAQTGLLFALGVVIVMRAAHPTRMVKPVACVALTVGVLSLWSVRPDSSIRETLTWFSYLSVLILTASSIQTWGAARRFLDALVVIGGWVCLVGLYIFWGADNPGMRWYSTFYWPNPFAAFLLLVIPLEAARLIHAAGGREASVHGAMTVLLLVPFILTYSRGAWLSLAGISVVALLIIHPPSWTAAVRRLLLVVTVSMLFVVILTRGSADTPSPPAVVGRAVSVANANDYSIRGRLSFWRAGLKMLADYPIAGTGPGTYAYSSAAYQPDVRYFARDVHNLYIQTGAEMGIIGIGVVAWLLASLTGLARRTLGTARGTAEYPLVAGSVLGVAAFFAHSALDMNWQFPVNGAVAFALIGVLARFDAGWVPQTAGVRQEQPRRRWAIPVAVALFGLAVLALFVSTADRVLRDGGKLAFTRQWTAAEAKFRLAARLNPVSPNAPSALSDVLQRNGVRNLEEHTALIRRAMSLDRRNAYYPLQLARFLSTRGPLDRPARTEVVGLVEHALALDPYHYPDGYMLLARLHNEAGDPQAAEAVYRRARAKYPPGFTQDGILRTMLWPGVAALYLDWAAFLRTEGRLADALGVYREILAEDPAYVPAYLGGADLLLRQGQVSAASDLLNEGLTKVPASGALWVRWRSLSVNRTPIWEQ